MSGQLIEFSSLSARGNLPNGQVVERWEGRKAQMKTRTLSQPAVDGWEVKPITTCGNSLYQVDAHQMPQFCRIRIAAVRNDFLR